MKFLTHIKGVPLVRPVPIFPAVTLAYVRPAWWRRAFRYFLGA